MSDEPHVPIDAVIHLACEVNEGRITHDEAKAALELLGREEESSRGREAQQSSKAP